jgi:3'-phosphoadenosine 5'-phosphosulfate sulfotransferase (PAPS reductase)/FAD synthetase
MTSELRERLAGRRVVASISGGKDSAAMSLWLTEQGIEHDRVFMDTGWEAPETYAYLADELPRAIGPITTIRPPLGMADLIRKKAMFPSRVRRFCTQELKVRPMQRHLRALMDAGADVVNAVGIRRGESLARSRMSEWEWSSGFDCETWRPILHWSEQDVIDIHSRHGLRPNPLYWQKGLARVGCWPCIFCRKRELRLLADVDPERIETIRKLEADVQESARARYAAKGETFESLNYSPPTFFQGPAGTREVWPIDEAVQWARTSRGGRQFELFAPDYRDEGCMRWGLCEVAADETEAA